MMVSNQIKFYRELRRIQATAMASLMRHTLMERPQASELNILIKSCDAELSDLGLEVEGDQSRLQNIFDLYLSMVILWKFLFLLIVGIEMLYFNCGRLHINTFYFFSTLSTTQDIDYDGLVGLYGISCRVINNARAVFYSNNATASCTAYVHRTMTLAAFIILKILRSCLASRVDLRTGEKAYFTVIVSLRASSLENDDLHARGAMILTQLWTSTRLFRGPDGVVNGLSLRIRTRSSMSVVFDCFWWWREEFQGKLSPFNAVDTQQTRTDGSYI
jgi:hypothetical protein